MWKKVMGIFEASDLDYEETKITLRERFSCLRLLSSSLRDLTSAAARASSFSAWVPTYYRIVLIKLAIN